MGKKKLLFVMNNLRVGGAEKALVSLLNELDYSQYQVDLLLFKQEGAFMSEIPSQVDLLPESKNYRYFDGPFIKVCKTFNPWLIYQRWRFKKWMVKGKNAAEAEQYGWNALQKVLSPLTKEYDVAIGYLEKNPIYYVVDKVIAKKKIGFIHNDYTSLGLNKNIDRSYFERIHHLCTISEKCIEVLKNEFSEFSHKISLVPNVISKQLLLKKADIIIKENYWDKTKYNIVSVGRLEKQKGFEISIQAAKILKDKGLDFKWYIIGEGAQRKELEFLIDSLGLKDHFMLPGLHLNPIKFMNQSDLVVQTSLFEGKSIVIDEAKTLGKTILLTNYPTAKDQIQDGITGKITGFEPENIAENIILLLKNKELQELFKENLNKENWNTGLQNFLNVINEAN